LDDKQREIIAPMAPLARERFRVGDLYLNRRITGALFAAQPFGGLKLSGTGIQAGGADYLKLKWGRSNQYRL